MNYSPIKSLNGNMFHGDWWFLLWILLRLRTTGRGIHCNGSFCFATPLYDPFHPKRIFHSHWPGLFTWLPLRRREQNDDLSSLLSSWLAWAQTLTPVLIDLRIQQGNGMYITQSMTRRGWWHPNARIGTAASPDAGVGHETFVTRARAPEAKVRSGDNHDFDQHHENHGWW